MTSHVCSLQNLRSTDGPRTNDEESRQQTLLLQVGQECWS
jgi:hypothetical protein